MPRKKKLPDDPRELYRREPYASIIITIAEFDPVGITTGEIRWIIAREGSNIELRDPKRNILLDTLAILLKKKRATKEDRKIFLDKLKELDVRVQDIDIIRPQELNRLLNVVLKKDYVIIDKIGDRYHLNQNSRANYIRMNDRKLLERYKLSDIIDQNEITFYGLKSDVFDARHSSKKRQPLLGKWDRRFRGRTLKVDDIFRGRKSISFKEAYSNITDNLFELKKEHRLEELQKIYEKNIESRLHGTVKSFLSDYSQILLGFISDYNWDALYLKDIIHSHPGECFDFSPIRLDEPQDYKSWKEYMKAGRDGRARLEFQYTHNFDIVLSVEEHGKFFSRLESLSSEEKDEIVNFLIMTREKVIELYPTSVMVFATV